MLPDIFPKLILRKVLTIPRPGPSERDKALIGKTLIGKYHLKAIIGSGGMGTVFRAEQVGLERDVAVKVLSEELSANPEHVKYFKDEARKLAQVSHPNIVQVYDVDTDQTLGIHFFVMELLDGLPLDRVIEKEGAWPLSRVALVIEALAAALSFAHERGLIHRDIKPANIFITSTGKPVLTDFGVAIRTAEAREIRGTAGTIPYMSPEQAAMQSLDHRSDIFSLGIVCYELLTGTSFFLSDNRFSHILKNLLQQADKDQADFFIPRLEFERALQSTLQQLSPAEVRPILRKALAWMPQERFNRATDFGKALVNLVHALERRRLLLQRISLVLRIGAAVIVGIVIIAWAINVVTGAMWPSQDNAMLFVSNKDGNEEIWVMNPDGSLQRRITNNKVRDIKPTWATDRQAIAFTSIAGNGIFIRYLKYPSGEPKILLSSCEDIDYARDGRVAVSKWNGKDWDIAVSVGDSLETVFSSENNDFRPRWSPDGKYLAFLSEVKRGIIQIFLLDLTSKGAGPRQLTFEGNNFDPAWSPDGSLIVFASNRAGDYDLYLMKSDGSDQHVLVAHKGNDGSPTWSPDGQRIAFDADTEGNMDIYVVNLDGKGLTRLTSSDADEKTPKWGR